LEVDVNLSTTESILVYMCSKKDACASDLALNRSLWLLDQNCTEVQLKLTARLYSSFLADALKKHTHKSNNLYFVELEANKN
jgi:hypothetical protein